MKFAFGVDDKNFVILMHRHEFPLAHKLMQRIEGHDESSIENMVTICEKLDACIKEDITPPKPKLKLV